MFCIPLLTFGTIGDLALLFLLVIIGIVIVVVIAKIILFILPASVITLVVWFLTGYNLFLAGIAFLLVAFTSLLLRH